ncbi:unnamed protein product [Urochloa humidicola]
MSRYGTIPATPPPEGSSSSTVPRQTPPIRLQSSTPDDAPGEVLAVLRPWRELADPRALSIPRDLTDAYHRASANIARSAANYELVLVGGVSASLLGQPLHLLIVLCSLLAWRRKSFSFVFTFAVVTLLRFDAAAKVVAVSLPVALLIVVGHTVLHDHFPADIGAVDEETGVVYHKPEPQATDRLASDAPRSMSSSTFLPLGGVV